MTFCWIIILIIIIAFFLSGISEVSSIQKARKFKEIYHSQAFAIQELPTTEQRRLELLRYAKQEKMAWQYRKKEAESERQIFIYFYLWLIRSIVCRTSNSDLLIDIDETITLWTSEVFRFENMRIGVNQPINVKPVNKPVAKTVKAPKIKRPPTP